MSLMISLRYWLFENPASHQHSLDCWRDTMFWRDNRGLEVFQASQRFWKDPKDMEGSHVLRRDFRSVVGPRELEEFIGSNIVSIY